VADATSRPRGLNLPRNEAGLATDSRATRRVRQLLPAFLDEFVTDRGADGAVVVLDGGVASTVTTALAVEALGSEGVTALVAPAGISDEAAAREAEAVASMLDVEYRRFQLTPLLGAFQEAVGESGEPADDLVATERALARFRMACAYYVADASNALVVGSVDRTRRLLGPLAKHGDTGVDCHLLGDLYRTEVTALARDLDVPEEIRDQSPHRARPPDGTNADRLDVSSRTVDRVLRLLVDEGHDPPAVADETGVDPDVVTRVATLCAETRRKRHQPPTPSTYM
jgi:NAD+ synthase